MKNQTNVGRTVVSGAYGAGEVISETRNTLTMRLLKSKTQVTVNKAGNLHYIAPTNSSALVVQSGS